MAGFFETLLRQRTGGELLAAWITEGKQAGARALFDGTDLVFRDAGFPEETAGAIRPQEIRDSEIRERAGSCLFLERIPDERRLVICGAGHVALCVIRLGVMLGYEVTVIEDREEYAEKAREAGAHRVLCQPFAEALQGISGSRTTAFVIMTREHAHDVECLRQILKKPYACAGMMGSRSRSLNVRQQLLEEGYDIRKVDAVHMPIGIPIGSRAPEEIAVSVAAELIQEMNAADAGESFPPGMAEELAALEKAGEGRGVLAMIVEKSGEAPRKPGTKMLVRKDGVIRGTVGGGYAEAVIREAAERMLREGETKSRRIRIGMTKGAMHCGGEIGVFLLRI